MKNSLARLYNFRGNLSRRDFLVYWLWVYLLPKIWPFLAAAVNYLIFGKDWEPVRIAGGLIFTVSIHLLLMSFFVGAMWRRLNDIGFALYPKLLICSLSLFFPPFGWMLQLTLLMLSSHNKATCDGNNAP